MTVRFMHQDQTDSDDAIALIMTRIKAIQNTTANNKGVTMKVSYDQLKANVEVEGGFLGALLGMPAGLLCMIVNTVLYWGTKITWIRAMPEKGDASVR